MIMDVTNGKMTFVNRIPEVFKVRIERVQIDKDNPKLVRSDITICSDGKFKRADMIVDTRNLPSEEKEYVRTHTKDEMIKWFTPRFLEKIPEYIRRLVELHMNVNEDVQIFFDSWKFDLFVHKIVDSAYITDLVKGDENDD